MDNAVSLGQMMGWGLDFWLPALAAAVIAYFCGCFNGAVIVSSVTGRRPTEAGGS